MNDDPIYQRLCESAWRRKLTDGEQAELRTWLAAHPHVRTDWENETALSELLTWLPDAPVPSNFTARVLQAVERDAAGERTRAPRWIPGWRRLVPRMAVAALVVGLGLFAYQRHTTTRRLELARSVAAVADVRLLPGPEILEDFDAIRRLNLTPAPDKDLLALMQ